MYEIVDLICKHEWNSKHLGYSLYFRFFIFSFKFFKNQCYQTVVILYIYILRLSLNMKIYLEKIG